MHFLIILLSSCVLVTVAAGSIKAVPLVWYGIAVALDIVYVYGIVSSLPPTVLQLVSVTVQRCTLATALFVIVMYCGVLPEHSAVRRRIGSIRAELSIIACILASAHCLNYLDSYIGVLSSNIGVFSGNQLASLLIAIILFVLMLVLGATSIKRIKRHMTARVWKNIQRSSYVFFALIYIHMLFILYPSAVKGSGDALLTCVVSSIVFVAYFIVRFIKFVTDRKNTTVRQTINLCSEEAHDVKGN